MKKSHKIIYWISTVWLALGTVSSGIIQLIKTPTEVEFIQALGYPVYFLTLLGIWKLLGTIAILAPRYPLVKEWAYAGFFFTMTGAVFSHLANGDAFTLTIPAFLLIALTVVSWYFRPASKKLVQTN